MFTFCTSSDVWDEASDIVSDVNLRITGTSVLRFFFYLFFSVSSRGVFVGTATTHQDVHVIDFGNTFEFRWVDPVQMIYHIAQILS